MSKAAAASFELVAEHGPEQDDLGPVSNAIQPTLTTLSTAPGTERT